MHRGSCRRVSTQNDSQSQQHRRCNQRCSSWWYQNTKHHLVNPRSHSKVLRFEQFTVCNKNVNRCWRAACVCMRVCVRVCAHACVCIHACVCVHVCMRVCVWEAQCNLHLVWCSEYTRMLFGICDGPATYQILLQVIIGDLIFQIVLVNLDNI